MFSTHRGNVQHLRVKTSNFPELEKVPDALAESVEPEDKRQKKDQHQQWIDAAE